MRNYNFDVIKSLFDSLNKPAPYNYDIGKSRQDAVKSIMDQGIADPLRIHQILNDPNFPLGEVMGHMRKIPPRNMIPMPPRPFIPNPNTWNPLAMRRPDVTTPIRQGPNGEIIV